MSTSLRAQYVPPIRRQANLVASAVHEFPASRVYDAGKNMAGVCTICTSGPAGAVLSLLYGELLFPNGTVNGFTAVAGQIKSPGSVGY